MRAILFCDDDVPMLFLSTQVYIPISLLETCRILREGWSVVLPSNLSSVTVKFFPSFCLRLMNTVLYSLNVIETTYHRTILSAFGFALYSQYSRTLLFSDVVTFGGFTFATGGSVWQIHICYRDCTILEQTMLLTIDSYISCSFEWSFTFVNHNLVFCRALKLSVVLKASE